MPSLLFRTSYLLNCKKWTNRQQEILLMLQFIMGLEESNTLRKRINKLTTNSLIVRIVELLISPDPDEILKDKLFVQLCKKNMLDQFDKKLSSALLQIELMATCVDLSLITSDGVNLERQLVLLGEDVILVDPKLNKNAVGFPKSFHICVCVDCFQILASRIEYNRHLWRCPYARKLKTFGKEIYCGFHGREKTRVRLVQASGKVDREVCLNLSRFAARFIASKTECNMPDFFTFYVLYRYSDGAFIGYFSRSEVDAAVTNLSCFFVNPTFGCQGFGQFLINLSYYFSRKQGRTGTPERPFTKSGLLCYRKYWSYNLFSYLCDSRVLLEKDISLVQIAQNTGIDVCDIFETFLFYDLFRMKGGEYILIKDVEFMKSYVRQVDKERGSRKLYETNRAWFHA
ncbi:hypothetical protein ACOME3_009459 [Neoechinorhynchus agilis]